MTKIAIICDTHAGVRNDAQCFIDNASKFYKEVFFPIIDEIGVEVILHGGDLTDRRKGISYKTAQTLRQDFLEPIAKRGIYGHIIVGNHDVSFKASNDTNALRELVHGRYPNIDVYQDPHEIVIDSKQFLLLPWICDGNREASMQAIASSRSDIVLGHLEAVGFPHYKNSPVATHGIDAGLFSRFDAVWSAHYHHKSHKGNFRYLGASAEFTWSDFNDDRGFHVFDTVSQELDFVPNPFKVFDEIRYRPDQFGPSQVQNQFDARGKIIRIIVEERGKPSEFDAFLKSLEDGGAEDVTVVDQPKRMTEGTVAAPVIHDGEDDMLALIRQGVSELKINLTDSLNALMESVYRDATQEN